MQVDEPEEADAQQEVDVPPEADAEEVRMAALIRAGDYAGALALFSAASSVNVRLINMAFTAEVERGDGVDAGALPQHDRAQRRRARLDDGPRRVEPHRARPRPRRRAAARPRRAAPGVGSSRAAAGIRFGPCGVESSSIV